MKDILIICADGLTGIKEAINAAYPQTEYQRCIVHQVRNTLKYVADKDRKAFATDLKTIYNAPTEQQGLDARERVTEKWQNKYPNAMKAGKRTGMQSLLFSSFHQMCEVLFIQRMLSKASMPHIVD